MSRDLYSKFIYLLYDSTNPKSSKVIVRTNNIAFFLFVDIIYSLSILLQVLILPNTFGCLFLIIKTELVSQIRVFLPRTINYENLQLIYNIYLFFYNIYFFKFYFISRIAVKVKTYFIQVIKIYLHKIFWRIYIFFIIIL